MTEQNKNPTAIEKRQKKNKELLLEQLKKTPILQIACDKTGIGRASVYRWKNEDPEFAKVFDEALTEGRYLINDVAISQLLNAIKNGNMSAVTFWLKNFDDNFKNKLEISGGLRRVREELTEEEAAMIAEALKFAGYQDNQLINETYDFQSREIGLPDGSDKAQPPIKA